MHNSYWYYALLVLSTSLFCFILFKKRNTHTLFVLLTMIGIGYIIETIIYIFLRSYEYYPDFIQHNLSYDSTLGAFVSNAACLPVVATLIAAFHLGWIWIIVFSGLFVGIEWLFLKLHIYSHNWWRLEYTGFGLLFYFRISKVYYRWIVQPSNRFKHYWILYLIIGSISASAHILPIIFFTNRLYTPGWFENAGQDSMAFGALFYLCASLFYCLMIQRNWKRKWIKYFITGFLMYVVNQILIETGILRSLVWWDQLYYVGLSLLLTLITEIIDKRLSKTASIALHSKALH